MPFVLKKFKSIKGKKIQQFLIDDAGLSLSDSQRYIAKARVFDENGNRLQNGVKLKCEYVQVAMFEGITKGLKPIFQTKDFAFFDKPTGIMVHPTSRNTKYTLLDEIRYHFGKNANLAHRIDQETSGLVLVTKNRYSDMILKNMFEEKLYKKKYLAVVEGKITKPIDIDSSIKKDTNSLIGVKMCVCDDGKKSFTTVNPISYDAILNQTLVEAIPLTGRQHQIRVHLNSIRHRIVGDPIYGVDENIADKYLLKKLDSKIRLEKTGANRLMLHAYYLEFEYEKYNYKIYSKLKFDMIEQ